MANLVDNDFVPPVEWAMELPGHYKKGRPVKVDKSGRVYGEVLPPPGEVFNRAGGRMREFTVPPLFPDETFADFHVNDLEFSGEDGPVEVPVGNIAFRGDGHPEFPVQAVTAAEAVAHLQRSGRPDLMSQLLAYGRVWRVPEGHSSGRVGALVFTGCVYPHVTKTDRRLANSTTISSDIWPHDGHGGRDQWIGVSRVDRTALPYPVAAGLEAGRGVVCVMDSEGRPVCYGCDDEPVAAALTGDADVGGLLREIESRLESLHDQVESNAADAVRVLEHVMKPEDLNQAARWDMLEQRLAEFDVLLSGLREDVDLLKSREQVDPVDSVGGVGGSDTPVLLS